MGVNRCVEARGSFDVALKGSSLDVLFTETSSQVHFFRDTEWFCWGVCVAVESLNTNRYSYSDFLDAPSH